MELQERVSGIIAALKDAYPDPVCALQYKKDYELMIAVRLSAQCTDERVNKITPALFARFPTLDAFADADIAEVEDYVRSCGFYKHKARDIVLACQLLREKYGGKVPGTMKRSCLFPVLAEKLRICCWVIFTKLPARSFATRTASASQTFWGSPRARTRQRSKRSCARFCRRRSRLISATGWCCTEEPSALPAARSAAAAASRPTAEAFRDSEQT